MSIGIGLYGSNGHQIHAALAAHTGARLVAVAAFPGDQFPAPARKAVRLYETLDGLLADPEIQLVSLCSPRRSDQAGDALRALRAGKHVYAEKPCALTEADLDALIATARESGRMFHEMAGTAFGAPYLAMRRIVRSGDIGEVVQVLVEKSYPYHPDRPQDEAIDGGLIAQSAIHGFRLVEQTAGVAIASVEARQTKLGNPRDGDLRMAAVMMLGLANGGLASVTANYLNPRGTGVWGDESLKILGTRGIVESIRGGGQTRLIVGEEDRGEVPNREECLDYLALYLDAIAGRAEMPLTMEQELSPTRWVIRARDKAGSNL
jgi:predicted dehydrogenase